MWREALRHRVAVLREEFLATTEELLDTQDHIQVLLSAIAAIAAIDEDAGLDAILGRVLASACELAQAQCGVLGVTDEDGSLGQLMSKGIGAEATARIDTMAAGRGVPGGPIRTSVTSWPTMLHTRSMAADVPANHPSLAATLRVPIRIGEEAFGSLYLTEKAGGGDFTPEDEPLCTALAAASGVAIEKARHCETNAHRRAWLEAGVKANESILTAVNDSSAETLGVITTHALAASGSSLAVIAFPTADGLRLACLASTGAGALPSRQEFARLPVINRVMTSGVSATLRTAAEALGPWARGTLGPALVVALDLAGIGQGVMILARAATSFPYTPEDAETSILFSSRVALAVELLHERGTRESVLLSDDRDRIARDLHDRVIQRIFAAVLSLQSLRRVITDEPSLQLVLAITNELDISIRELRETIYSLNQQPDVREQLGHRLLRTITTLSADAGFEPRIDFAGPLDDGIPVAVSEHLVAVLTEGLSNTIRHSGASNVTITVDVGPLYLALVITDDGDGFDSPCHTSGLRTMNDRATLLGGTCAVESTPGKGTELTWRVPHNRPGAKAAQ